MNENSNSAKKNTGSIVFSIVFLIWFFGSLVGLILTSKASQMGWMTIVFGQYFVVFGLAGTVNEIKSGFRHPIILTLPIVGFSIVTCGLLWQFGDATRREQIIKQIPNVAFCVFLIVGLLLFAGIIIEAINQKKCTYAVQGRCVEIKWHYGTSGNGRSGKTYCPVYEYNYNGRTYTGCQEIYTKMLSVCEGEYKEIFLNPMKPEMFYEKDRSRALNVISLFIGICFVAVSVIAIYAYNFM